MLFLTLSISVPTLLAVFVQYMIELDLGEAALINDGGVHANIHALSEGIAIRDIAAGEEVRGLASTRSEELKCHLLDTLLLNVAAAVNIACRSCWVIMKSSKVDTGLCSGSGSGKATITKVYAKKDQEENMKERMGMVFVILEIDNIMDT